ncbi:Uncharacterized protein DAT39_013779, partial [Clarias magur]
LNEQGARCFQLRMFILLSLKKEGHSGCVEAHLAQEACSWALCLPTQGEAG